MKGGRGGPVVIRKNLLSFWDHRKGVLLLIVVVLVFVCVFVCCFRLFLLLVCLTFIDVSQIN